MGIEGAGDADIVYSISRTLIYITGKLVLHGKSYFWLDRALACHIKNAPLLTVLGQPGMLLLKQSATGGESRGGILS